MKRQQNVEVPLLWYLYHTFYLAQAKRILLFSVQRNYSSVFLFYIILLLMENVNTETDLFLPAPVLLLIFVCSIHSAQLAIM